MIWSPRALKFSSWSPGALEPWSPGALNPFGTLYHEALGLASLQTLFERGQAQTVKLFQNISNNPGLANYAVFFFYRVQTNTVLI